MRFAYADPPYLGNGKKRYGEHPEAAIWDDKQAHVELVNQLVAEFPDGWALSCNPADLRWLLPVCPEEVRVAAWTKTFHQIRHVHVQYAWEPLLFMGGRHDPAHKPMTRDWHSCVATRKKGTIGSKPDSFNNWVLEILGFDPARDELVDMFPGSGGMTRLVATVGNHIQNDISLFNS
jgi:hypothetical protein